LAAAWEKVDGVYLEQEGIGGCRFTLNTFSDGSRNLAVISGVCPNGLHDLAPIGTTALTVSATLSTMM
jgi:hypothetical protein